MTRFDKFMSWYPMDLLYSFSLYVHIRTIKGMTRQESLERDLKVLDTAISDRRKKLLPYKIAVKAINYHLKNAKKKI